jgi:hypothetical protein
MVSATAARPVLDVSRVARYVESCRVADGGYFFAQIPPAGAQDTYFALACLRLLGREPQDAPDVRRWVEEWRLRPGNLGSIHSVYLLCGLLEELGQNLDWARPYARLVRNSENRLGGFGAWKNVYVESASELQSTYEAVSVLLKFGYPLDGSRIARFLKRFQRHDGGFGVGRSTLASTYYACATLAQLGSQVPLKERTNLYLQRRAQEWGAYCFLDDVFWLIQGLALSGGAATVASEAATHVLACQRPKGGFARAPAIGIPTLEYTYCALQVLDSVGLLRA